MSRIVVKCYECEKEILDLPDVPYDEWEIHLEYNYANNVKRQRIETILRAAREARLHIVYNWHWPRGDISMQIYCTECKAKYDAYRKDTDQAF